MKTLTQIDIDNFSATIRGRVVTDTDSDYDAVRSIWNDMIDRRPKLMVQCSGTADVVSCIKFIKESGINFSIRSGGHNIAGSSIRDDALMIDLSTMNSVFVDSKNRRAYVEPGALLGDVDHETQLYGLATSLGINSTTGVAGLTLGGGFGWISRKHGMTVDNLIAAQIVTADGESIRVSKDAHPDLFWAIRGGGGNFGIVTQFELQLHPVGPEVFCGLIALPFDSAKETLKKYREYTATLPDEMSIWAVIRKAPPLPFLPEEVHGKEVVIMAFLYIGDEESGAKLIEPVRKFAEPHGEFFGMMPYKAWQQIFDPLLTPGARNYWKSHNFERLNDEMLDVIVEYASKIPSSPCEIFIAQMGGYTSRQAITKTAYVHRKANYIMNVHARWDDSSEDELCIAWARAFFKSATPHAMGGAYVNFMTEEENERVPSAYGENYAKLTEIKEKYDPENIFNLNQNIKPK
ncbi:MAG: FAD-binding protein [Sulfurovum sp.]|nr:FAD-binding protein [Sulfurovum sp.]